MHTWTNHSIVLGRNTMKKYTTFSFTFLVYYAYSTQKYPCFTPVQGHILSDVSWRCAFLKLEVELRWNRHSISENSHFEGQWLFHQYHCQYLTTYYYNGTITNYMRFPILCEVKLSQLFNVKHFLYVERSFNVDIIMSSFQKNVSGIIKFANMTCFIFQVDVDEMFKGSTHKR